MSLSREELFRPGGPTGLQEISDDTLRMKIDAAEQARLRRLAEPGYADALAEEMLQMPEAITNRGKL